MRIADFGDAVSYVECKVVSRMDANDHWVIYTAIDGGVFNKDNENGVALKSCHVLLKKCTSQQSIYPLSIALFSSD